MKQTSLKLSKATHQPSQELETRARQSLHKLLERKDLGFFQLPSRAKNWTSAIERSEDIKKNNRRLAVLGIGGSSLGGIALQESLQLKGLEFFENVDAKDFWERLSHLPLAETHWAIVSKSGKTVETLTQANFIHEFMKSKNMQFSRHVTVISELRSNPLSNWARDHKVPILEIPEDVGGRFSVLTPVGLLPAAFGGADVLQMKAGAEEALQNQDLIAHLVAQYLKSFAEEKWISVFWAYCNRLRYYGLWIEQLWAESLGKRTDRKGKPAPRASTPISLIGANDQHSVLQQVAEGPKDKFVSFLRVAESESYGPKLTENMFAGEDFVVGKTMGQLLAAEAAATQMALEEAHVPSLSLVVDRLDARTMGALFMMMELVVGTLGEALDINAFDQPGVELGKRLAKEILLK